MSDKPRDLTLERINRLSTAVADLMESHTSQGRMVLKMLTQISDHLEGVEKAVRELASEQVLLGNRVENAFSRTLRTNIRLDEIEDKQEQAHD